MSSISMMIMLGHQIHFERIKGRGRLEVKTKKPKQVNQENFDIMAIINEKKVKHKANLDVIDFQNNMETLVTKWKCIIELVNTNGNFEHHHNEPTCKDKWGVFVWKVQEYP